MNFFKSLFGNNAAAQAEDLTRLAHESYPAPSMENANYQKEVLDGLRNSGNLCGNFTLTGISYLCKKGEKIIYAFNNVEHYCSSVHSEWTGRSAGTSVRIARGFWIRTGANKGHSVQQTTMDRQGGGCLVLTNQALAFFSQEKSARIPLSHVMSFQASTVGLSKGYADEFGFAIETDYARNNNHQFFGINPVNVEFIKSFLELLANGTTATPPTTPPPLPPVAPVAPPTPPVAPAAPPIASPVAPVTPHVAVEDGDFPHLKFRLTHGPGT